MSSNIPATLLPVFLLAIVIGVTSCQTLVQETADKKSDISEANPIEIDGSETVFSITEMAVKEFQTRNHGKVAITIDAAGTGKGIDKFCRGKMDIANASRLINSKEMVVCNNNGVNFLELPIAYDAISVVINTSNNWATNLKLADLKKIWGPESQGKIVNWKDVRPDFPDTPLRIFTEASSSGTYDYFTKVINGKAKVARTDVIHAADTKAIIKGVTDDVDAIGFVSYVYASINKNQIHSVGIDSGKGPVLPSIATVNNNTYTPLTRPLFIYVSSKSLTKPNVKEFIDYYLANASKFVTSQNYIPLSATAYTKIQAKAQARKFGSDFGDKGGGNLKVEDFTTKIAK